MNRLLLLLFVITIASNTMAQNWSPKGAKWTFGVSYATPPFNNIHFPKIWAYTNDSLVGGKNCKVIQGYGDKVVYDIADKLITYEDSNIVYWYNGTTFTTLYDFNKKAGESWTFTLDTCNLLITVVSTGMDTINGVPLKTLTVSSEGQAFNGKILQHIGHLSMPNPSGLFHCYGIISDVNYYTGLRCYEDSIIGSHNFGITSDCNYTTTSISDIQAINFNIHPNPATTHITISTPHNLTGNTLTIHNTIGQQVATHTIPPNHIIQTDQLSKGIYFIQINHLNSPITTKLIIQ